MLGARGARYPEDGRVEGRIRSRTSRPMRRAPAANGRVRARRRHHGRQLLRPHLDEGCAFEELISFHGGIGGLQTRPFILHPAELEFPGRRSGAASVHGILTGWRGSSMATAATPLETGVRPIVPVQ